MQAWLADIDPANTALLVQERMRFANLRQFRFTTFDLHIDMETGLSTAAPIVQGNALPTTDRPSRRFAGF